jgi:hypothetical protein
MSTNDPFESASNPQVKQAVLFGQAKLDAWHCVLPKKGTGGQKAPFDPALHKPEQRLTALDLSIQPLPEHNMNFASERNMLAEGAEWAKHTWPSAKAAGLTDARQINGGWFKYTFAPTGEKYPKKDKQTGQPTGEMVEKTAIKFLEFYKDEDTCRAAYQKEHTSDDAGFTGTVNLSAQAVAPDPEKEKATALAFLRVIVPNAARGKSLEDARLAVADQIHAYPVVSAHFTVDSPEVAEILNGLYPAPEPVAA